MTSLLLEYAIRKLLLSAANCDLQTEINGFIFVFLKLFIKKVPRKKLDCTIRTIKSQCGFGNLINKKEILIRTMAKRY